MDDPCWLLFFEFLCDSTGRACWAGFSVDVFLQRQVSRWVGGQGTLAAGGRHLARVPAN